MPPEDVNEIGAWAGSILEGVHMEDLREGARLASGCEPQFRCAQLYSAAGRAKRIPLIMMEVCSRVRSLAPALPQEGSIARITEICYRARQTPLVVHKAPVPAVQTSTTEDPEEVDSE